MSAAQGVISGGSGSGTNITVKLNNPKKWDAWLREVHGIASRDDVLNFVHPPEVANLAEDWHVLYPPATIDIPTEHARLMDLDNERLFQLERDRLNVRVSEYHREYAKYEKRRQALADLTLAMKRSASDMNQGVLNHLTDAHEVYEYLGRTYAPTQRYRIQDVRSRVEALEKANWSQNGIESWLLSWKDVAQKLLEMGLFVEVDSLRQKFQRANKAIRSETETFMLPKVLNDNVNLEELIEDALTYYRLNPPTTRPNRYDHNFAAFQGRRQDGSYKKYKCFDGDHTYQDCPYVNVQKRQPGWVGDPNIWEKFEEIVQKPRDKRGGAVKGTLLRLGKSWEDVKPKGTAKPDISYTMFESATFQNLAQTEVQRYKNVWIIDPGSQRHICNRETRIRNLRRVSHVKIIAGNHSMDVIGYCDALIRIPEIDGVQRNVWLTQAAFVPDAPSNLVSTSMLNEHGVYLSERTGSLENRNGQSLYFLCKKDGLWIGEEMWSGMELDWVHLVPFHPSFSSFERRSTKGDQLLWHRRLGHVGQAAIDHLEGSTRGGRIDEDDGDPRHLCERCSISKAQTNVSRRSRNKREEAPLLSKPFSVLHTDLICPTIPAYDNSTVYAHDFDEITKMHGGKGLQSKADWPGAIVNRIAFLERQYGTSILRIMTDSDPVLGRVEFRIWLAQSGRVHEQSPPYTHEANGTSEVAGRLITWMGRTLFVDSGLPRNLWPLIYDASAYILNRVPTKALGWETPLGRLYALCGYPNVQPFIEHLRVYGCLSYVYDRHVPVGDKLRPRALQGWLVGYTASNIWKIWIPSVNSVVDTRDVLFDENVVYREYQNQTDKTFTVTPPMDPDEYFDLVQGSPPQEFEVDENVGTTDDLPSGPSETYNSAVKNDVHNEPIQQNEDRDEGQQSPAGGQPTDESQAEHLKPSEQSESSEASKSAVPQFNDREIPFAEVDTSAGIFDNRATQRERDISERENEQPPKKDIVMASDPNPTDATMTGFEPQASTGKRSWDEINFRQEQNLRHDVLYAWFMAESYTRRPHQSELPPPPENWHEAQNHPFWEQWLSAAENEIKALEEKHTWEVVSIPKGIFVVPVKWVFSYKFDDNGYVEKFKARLCVRGDLQRRFGDVGDTRALTLAVRTLRFMMAMAAAFDLEIDQMDVSSAFLHASVPPDETILVATPPGFQQRGRCCRLLRALYGMVDSPARWQRHLESVLYHLGFCRISTEACLYTNGKITILCYVDDLALFARREDRAELDELKKLLADMLDIRDCGELKWFLGIRILRDRQQQKIWLSQDGYIDRIVNRFGLERRPAVSIPLTSIPLGNSGVPASRRQILDYLARMGSLQHPAVVTRPDIAAASSILGSFSGNPSLEHMSLAERCIIYLRDHKYLAICFDGRFRAPTDTELIFKGASDASYADDKETRRSTEGYLFKLFGGAVDWKARKQQTVTTSTTEAELLSLQHAVKELQAWNYLFNEVEFDTEQSEDIMECDNAQTVRLIDLDNPIVKTNIRHIHVSDLWVRQEHREGRVNVRWVTSDHMDADGLTKPLPKAKFDRFITHLGMEDVGHLIKT